MALGSSINRPFASAILAALAFLPVPAGMAFATPAGGAAQGPMTPAHAPAVEWSREDAAHLLRRAGFSGTPDQISKLHAMGMERAVDYLITGALPAGMSEADAPFVATSLDAMHLDPAPADASKGAQRKKGVQELEDQWIARMVHTDRPLEEKMTLFWHGLFTSGIREVKDPNQMLAQNQLFHHEAIGNYRTLTLAIIHDPAMLKYLNNNENVKGKPNENLARELCELFTMGEGQGYTETDVHQIALALTGATVAGGKKNAQGGYQFRAAAHDNSVKTIFGQAGRFKPDDVVDLIFQQPEPAQHLARRLWEFFAYPDPSDEVIAPVAAALREHHYDVVPALRVLFTSPDFYGEKAKFAIIKSPTDLLVSTVRLLDQPFDAPREQRAAGPIVGTMGQELFEPPNVRGWPGGENWITAATLFSRYNTAAELIDDDLHPDRQAKSKANAGAPAQPKARRGPRKNETADGALSPHAASPRLLFPELSAEPSADQVVDAAIRRFLQRPLHPEKRKVLIDALGSQPLRLGDRASDDRIREMLGLLLSTPEYQVE
jgi:uncharacterized protein (DUF1800 family)